MITIAGAAQQSEMSVASTANSCSRRARVVALLLIVMQSAVVVWTVARNSITVDERDHLAAGLYYWTTGEFWVYHHNPPLAKLVQAVGPMLLGRSALRGTYEFRLHDRGQDSDLGHRYWEEHRESRRSILTAARLMNLPWLWLGGWVVFRWSASLWGGAGGLLSLAVWVLSPWILAHGALATPDFPVTSLLAATGWLMWCYFRQPCWERAFLAGAVLGLALATKFTALLAGSVFGACGMLLVIDVWRRGGPRAAGRRLLEGAILAATALLTVNTIYGWEAPGKRLGEFPFRSATLSRAAESEVAGGAGVHESGAAFREADGDDSPPRVNRFADSWLGGIPVPLPEQYLLGLDDQLWDLDSAGWWKFLRGAERGPDESGWWWYYPYGFAVKTPVGSLALFGAALGCLLIRRMRSDLFTELLLLATPAVVFFAVSRNTRMCDHVRYLLPVLPFLSIAVGRLIQVRPQGALRRAGVGVLAALLCWDAWSVARVCPFPLAYFNDLAGGPLAGPRHLSGSDVDWGQGRYALDEWLLAHGQGETISVQTINILVDETFSVPVQSLTTTRPAPGLHVISAAAFGPGCRFVPAQAPGDCVWPPSSWRAYLNFEPIAAPGFAYYVYRMSEADIDRAACW